MEEIEVGKVYSNKDTAEKLRRLADCLENGTAFEIQVDGQRIYVPASAEVEFEYEQEGNERELEVEIKWKTS